MSNDTPKSDFAPHMVMASRYSPLLYAIRDIDPDICVLVHHKQATPILTVSLEEAARRASNVWHARDAVKMWQAIVLEICALKVREARDVATPRALPDRETLAREMYCHKYKSDWEGTAEYTKNFWRNTADRALELCAGAAPDQSAVLVDGHDAQYWYDRTKALGKGLTNAVARAEKAEAERDFEKKLKERFIADRDAEADRADKAEEERDAATKRAQEAEADYKRLQQTNESLRIELNELGDKEILLSAERDGLRAQLAKAQRAAAVPATPTLAELEKAEEEALRAFERAVQRKNTTSMEDENAFARAKAMFVYRQAEYGRAAAAVDAHKKENQ